ncbi:hypothetical protein BLL52_1785 [Rhodoferax antarcticus ANT.BR]|uniref:Uncharacterized protein n=1 Tax=Rhodoferax antarcticus ANT.BR TaxID=1111071 RepID=A0A1Q8YG63_9BURK|nr:hypothetical protein BLL52_1785 [Rhodoferax antarcticus ANT.BR]
MCRDRASLAMARWRNVEMRHWPAPLAPEHHERMHRLERGNHAGVNSVFYRTDHKPQQV